MAFTRAMRPEMPRKRGVSLVTGKSIILQAYRNNPDFLAILGNEHLSDRFILRNGG
ncbi:hypothetical protein [Burkholderia oklahomensis]|uniref:hypothetical protein n=1 Tax=Burkholderia oklahomensis TaxID=342113 RepID=UPI0012F4C784|nr:hypothetical protein [Burkholderia oklahomensis]MBI0359511.1 hypothetical protein [Burkholderia oklahomensis]